MSAQSAQFDHLLDRAWPDQTVADDLVVAHARLRMDAEISGYQGDLSTLRTGTIHGVCNEFVDRYRHLTPLGNGYEAVSYTHLDVYKRQIGDS